MATNPDPAAQRFPAPAAGRDLEFNLQKEVDRLRSEPAWSSGRNARTLVKHPDFRVVLTVVRGGIRIREHRAAGRISVETVAGHICMHLPGKTVDMPVGSLLALDRDVPHDVEAVTDSAFLLTIAWPEQQ